MCVEGGLCVILSFKRFKTCDAQLCVGVRYSWVGVRSLYVELRDYAGGTRRPSVLMRRNSKPRKSVHWHPTFISRMNRKRITYIAERKCLYVERSQSVRVWTRFVSDSCVGRASNVREIVHRICSYASTCAIFQWLVSDC